MAEKTPAQVAATNRLREWAVSPTGGGALFKWGTEGDFARCEAFYRGKVPNHMIPGWCSNLHQLATGHRPGHAPSEGGDGK